MAAGERGPKGDHGQHGDEGVAGAIGEQGVRGDTGLTGDAGERGQHGDTGQSGEQGATGARGPSNWQSYVAMGIAVIVAFAVFGAQLNDKPSKEQTAAIAKLAADNARTIDRVEKIRADAARDAREAKRALCAFRFDLELRVASAIKFLAEHPEGLPGLATPKQLRDDLENRQRTISSLSALHCPKPPTK